MAQYRASGFFRSKELLAAALTRHRGRMVHCGCMTVDTTKKLRAAQPETVSARPENMQEER